MGVSITELLTRNEIALDDLSNKTLVVDAPMWLYQFLSSIRQIDGSYLSDAEGNPTSHLVGLSSRIPNLLEKKIRLAFVFDGMPPELKIKELERRKTAKLEAAKRFEKASEEKDLDAMKKFASRTVKVSQEMIAEAKELISAFGIPCIQAPSEAEAQGSYIVRKKDAYALATNDADALMFGAPLVVRNLNVAGKRRQAGRSEYKVVNPEMINLNQNLENLGITKDQLIALCMLVGTDFNPKGIKGVGPKKALDLVRRFNEDFDPLFLEVGWKNNFDFEWQDVFSTIKNMPFSDDYSMKGSAPDFGKIRELLVEKHGFASERIDSVLERLEKSSARNQKSLADF